MFRVLFVASILFGANATSNVVLFKDFLVKAESTLSLLKSSLMAENAKRAVQIFEEMVETFGDLGIIEVSLQETGESPELENEVGVLIEKYGRIIPFDYTDRKRLLADIQDIQRGPKTMRTLLKQFD